MIEPMEAPRALTRPLLGFQREGLRWMVENESTDARGGILADEMGMGKTIQCIALLLARKEAWMRERSEIGEMVTESDRRRRRSSWCRRRARAVGTRDQRVR